MENANFFSGKKVLVTGHTGFKGVWLCKMLLKFGAQVTGYSLMPATTPNLFELTQIEKEMESIIGDVRNLTTMMGAFEKVNPEIVIHLAAQPLVRESYQNPVYTYETNVMGTVNILECIRKTQSVRSFLNVTTDKVYENKEWQWGYRENEPLNGQDPYANSKSCSELVTDSYKKSFFAQRPIAVSTARAGNVIGGGDFANDRILPDCIRSTLADNPIIVRNPHSIRPYQHVIEPLFAYLMIVQKQYEDVKFADCYNVGPDACDSVTTEQLATLFCEKWGKGARWENQFVGGPHEANFLKLDNTKLKATFDWKPRWYIDTGVEKTVEWTKVYAQQGDINACMNEQIDAFLSIK